MTKQTSAGSGEAQDLTVRCPAMPVPAVERIRLWLSPTSGEGTDLLQAAPVLVLCAVALGYALQLANGAFHPSAIAVLAAVIALVAVSLAAPAFSAAQRWAERGALALGAAGLVYELGVHLTTMPGMYLRASSDAFVQHHFLISLAAVTVGVGLAGKGLAARAATPVLLLVFLLLGFWMLRASPNPIIDVFAWHKEAFAAIGRGVNPYSIFMPNIYGTTQFYGPGIADATKVYVGFPYPPLSLLVAAPAHLLSGDYRYANVLALTAAGGLMASARNSRLGFLAAAIFLFTPRSLFFVEQGWTDALVCFFLALVVFVACRAPRTLPVAFGLLLAIKQYSVLLLPLGLLVFPRPFERGKAARFLGIAVGLAALLVVPFALFGLEGFYRSVVQFQSLQPFRTDALSLMAWTARDGVPSLPLWFSFLLVPVGLALAWWRAPRTASGFALSSALVLLLFFGFAKQAFCNYYFVILAAICCALAALPVPAPETKANR